MPIAEPIAFGALETFELLELQQKLFKLRATGLRSVTYADQSSNVYRSDAEMAAALAAIQHELARRGGATAPTTILVAASKGLQ